MDVWMIAAGTLFVVAVLLDLYIKTLSDPK